MRFERGDPYKILGIGESPEVIWNRLKPGDLFIFEKDYPSLSIYKGHILEVLGVVHDWRPDTKLIDYHRYKSERDFKNSKPVGGEERRKISKRGTWTMRKDFFIESFSRFKPDIKESKWEREDPYKVLGIGDTPERIWERLKPGDLLICKYFHPEIDPILEVYKVDEDPDRKKDDFKRIYYKAYASEEDWKRGKFRRKDEWTISKPFFIENFSRFQPTIEESWKRDDPYSTLDIGLGVGREKDFKSLEEALDYLIKIIPAILGTKGIPDDFLPDSFWDINPIYLNALLKYIGKFITVRGEKSLGDKIWDLRKRLLEKGKIPFNYEKWIKEWLSKWVPEDNYTIFDNITAIYGDLDLRGSSVEYLPGYLYINGSLFLQGSKIKDLSTIFKIEKDLYLEGTEIKDLPRDLDIRGKVYWKDPQKEF